MHTYVNHAHVTWAFVVAGLGAVAVVLGIIRKIAVIVVLAVVVVIAGIAVGLVSLHGKDCGPDNTSRVCVSIR